MALQGRLALLPPGSQILSTSLAVCRHDGMLTFFNAGGPILLIEEGNRAQARLAAAQLSDPKLGLEVKLGTLADVLGVHRSTIHNARRRYERGGLDGLNEEKRGPKRAHKLTGRRLARAQEYLDAGLPNTAVAEKVGVTEGAIRLALRQNRLRRLETTDEGISATDAPDREQAELRSPADRMEEDVAGRAGMAVKRHEDRALAAVGQLQEAAPSFEAAESVAKAGVLIALPALVSQGLFDVAEEVYGTLRNGFFGLRATVATFVFMALLRLKSIEQLSSHAPGEFGRILGLDRAPEPKTLRRKLAEMGKRKKALALRAAFMRRWAQERPDLLGFLYVDGHVRPYNGRKHRLPKTHVPRRRLCMPAATDYWVNDAEADPLFFVTAPGNEGMLAVLEEAIMPEVREIAGDRRVTLVMDRECWSPKRFKAWSEAGFDVMTYRKGNYEAWPDEVFAEFESPRAGRKRSVLYKLAERTLTLSGRFEVREVRCLTETGHQTSVVTTRRDMSLLDVAERMFSRWRQENYFHYMRHQFALDHLPTYKAEWADPERLIPNPARKQKKQELGELRGKLARLQKTFGRLVHEDAFETLIERVDLRGQIADLEEAVEELSREEKALPSHVAVGEVRDPHEIVQLEQERKIIADQMKTVAYRAETELAALLRPLLGSHEDEARSFLRRAFQLPADVVPQPEEGVLLIRLHSMANWRSNRALAALCAILNCYETRYPGTELRIVFEAPPSN